MADFRKKRKLEGFDKDDIKAMPKKEFIQFARKWSTEHDTH